MPLRRVSAALFIAAVIAAYFLLQAGAGLYVHYHMDDMMNMFFAYDNVSWARLIGANLTPFSTLYRPMGSLYYRTMYELFGLDPFPPRVVTYLIHALNTLLVFLLVRRLSGSREIAVLAAAIWCYHRRMMELYLNNGTIYDILSFTFYFLALLVYIRARESGRFSWRTAVLTLAFFTASVNAKEMGATLPLLLLAYEFIYRRPQGWTGREWFRWVTRDLAVIWIALAAAGVAAWVRTGQSPQLAGHPLYTPHLTVKQYFRNSQGFLDEIFWQGFRTFKTSYAVILWVGMLAAAALAKRRYLWFGLALIFFAPLPVIFIEKRGLFTHYIPYAGWAVFAAGILVEGRDWLWRRLWQREPIPPGILQPERLGTLALVLLSLAWFNDTDPMAYRIHDTDEARVRIRQTLADFEQVSPCPKKGGRVLFLDDRYPVDDWGLLFAVKLACDDNGLYLERGKKLGSAPPAEAWKTFDKVLTYRDGRLVLVQGRKP